MVALQYIEAYDAWQAAYDLYRSTNSLFIYLDKNFGRSELTKEVWRDLPELKRREERLHRCVLSQAAFVESWHIDDD